MPLDMNTVDGKKVVNARATMNDIVKETMAIADRWGLGANLWAVFSFLQCYLRFFEYL